MAMDTQHKIKKEQSKLNRLESSLAKQKLKDRSSRARKLIESGGLVNKAKLDHLPKDILLGALVHIRELLENEPAHEDLFQAKGKAEFLKHKETDK